MAKVKKDKEEGENVDSVQVAAQAFFKMNKDDIYTDVSEPYKVSTGVLALDSLLDGGICGGTQCRLLGPPTSGKSSEGLLIIKNFLETRPKSRGLVIPTEARLTEKLQKRSGVKFVSHPDEWVNNTCLILPMNIYEKIANFLWTLVKTNEMRPKDDRENFIVMVDCMDYLSLGSESAKEFGDARKIAGPQYLTKMLWSKMALPFNAGQHIFLAISQQSAAPKIDPYAKDPLRQGGSSGGTNIQYQASTVLDFCTRYEGDYILEDPDSKYDPKKNNKIGHVIKGFIRKSDNEKYDVKFEYAVKYGANSGNSIWKSREVAEGLLMMGYVTRDKNTLIFSDEIIKEAGEIKLDIKKEMVGEKKYYNYLENNTEICDFLYKKLKSIFDSSGKSESF